MTTKLNNVPVKEHVYLWLGLWGANGREPDNTDEGKLVRW